MNKARGHWLQRLLWPGVAAVLLMVAFSQPSRAATGKTGKSQAEQYRHFLERNLTVISRKAQAVRIESTAGGKVGKYDPSRHQWATSFVVEEGDSFFQRNHHARVEFTVQTIKDDGVTIKARSLVMPRDRASKAGNDSVLLKLPYRERTPEH